MVELTPETNGTPPRAASATSPGRMNSVASPAFRILLVEDNPGDARLIAELLRGARNEFALTVVQRLAEALEVLRRQLFDAVLLDLSLPDSTGLGTFETLYAEARRVPIIVLTGNTDSAVALEAVQLGAQDYLLKAEIDERLLPRTIRYTIERHRLNERLEQSERVKGLGHVAAKIAHEFNNVLMGIQPFAELIGRYGGSDPRIATAAASIIDSVRRGRTISTEILRYTRPAVVLSGPIDVGEWLEGLCDEMKRMLAPAFLACAVDPTLVVAGDRHQLSQVLVNLVRNARDAAGPDGEILIFASRVESSGRGHVCIEVQDNGQGMTAEVLQHAFEPLFTTKHTGTGLGLAIAKQIVEAHGGQLSAESVPGGGSTFRMLLPPAPATDGRTDGATSLS